VKDADRYVKPEKKDIGRRKKSGGSERKDEGRRDLTRNFILSARTEEGKTVENSHCRVIPSQAGVGYALSETNTNSGASLQGKTDS